jgi:hypothetical protein
MPPAISSTFSGDGGHWPGPVHRQIQGVLGAIVQFRQRANGGEVVGPAAQHLLEFDSRLLELPKLEQRPPERHPRRDVVGKLVQAFAAQADGALQIPGATEPLRNRTERRLVLSRGLRLLGLGFRSRR